MPNPKKITQKSINKVCIKSRCFIKDALKFLSNVGTFSL